MDGLEKGRELHNSIESYWLNKFSGERSKNYFLYDFKNNGNKRILEEKEFQFSPELFSQLMKLSNRSDPRLPMILVTGLIVLLNRYTGNNDITVAVPIYKQEKNGDFINTTLPLRNIVKPDVSFKGLLLQVRQSILEAVENQNYPVELLTQQLKNQDPDSSLFEMVILLKNIHKKEYIQHLNLDMCFIFNRTAEGLDGILEYNSRIYLETSIQGIIHNFTRLLEEAVYQLDTQLTAFDMLTGEERRQILFDFNNTVIEYPRNKTIHALFQEQSERTPSHRAMVYRVEEMRDTQAVVETGASTLEPGTHHLSYRELNEKVNQLARLLRGKGVKPDTIVAIMIERSVEMIVGIFGILKAGGAYLPIDPDYPQETIHYMLSDCGARIMLTGSESNVKAELEEKSVQSQRLPLEIINLRESPSILTSISGDSTSPNNLAYVIYTSGSTGRPKGVGVEHRSVVNRLTWMQRCYHLGGNDSILQKTAVTFDVSVWELFWWSWQGASVCLLKHKEEMNPQAIAETIEVNRVTTIHFVPSMLNVFLEYIEQLGDVKKLDSLKRVFSSGEALLPHQVNWFNNLFKGNHGIKLVNLYGPTEATVDVSYFNCPFEKNISKVPIGKPIDNIKLYVIDLQSRLQAVGIPGELCISGDGLARGYVNRPGLTREKFLDNPFIPGEKMYKTGDLAMWLPDGAIEFLGRIDHQVKIRGFRIELGEIESHLLKFDEIKEAVVTAREEENGEKYLCAYIVSKTESDISELRDFLSRRIPAYMIPTCFVSTESIPLLSNGKVDRKNLPAPGDSRAELKGQHIAPRNKEERLIAAVWNDVLNVEKIGIHDNFFKLGGHSLKAVSIITRINKEFRVKLPLSIIFGKPTISGLAEELSVGKDRSGLKVEKCIERNYYELSHSQKRLWFFHQMAPENPSYNIPLNFHLRGELVFDAFKKAIEMLIKRHESLRTSLKVLVEDGMPQQVIDNPKKVSNDILQIDISNMSPGEKERKLVQLIEHAGTKPFDLTQAPLIRTSLIKLGRKEHAVVFVMHHIICDAWSHRIIYQEFLYFYNKFVNNQIDDLPPLRFHYKEFAYWQNQLIASGELKIHQDYWKDKLAGELPVLKLPIDYPLPTTQNLLGDQITFMIDESLNRKLKQLAVKMSCSMFMILMAALKVLLYRYSHQEDIIIGALTAGRTADEFEKVVGYFVNIVALRDTVKGESTFEDFMGNVRKTVLDAFDHQDYPFDKLVDELKVQRDAARTPVFNTMVAFQNFEDVQFKSSPQSLEVEAIEKQYVVNKYDLYLDMTEMPHHVNVDFEFRTELFKKETILRMKGHYLDLLESIARTPDQLIRGLDILSEAETRQLLEEFNDTRRDIPRKDCFNRLFERQVHKSPGRIAVKHNGLTATYQELNELANQVGHYLVRHGATPNSMVGLMMKRSIHMLAAIIGVFKSGAAYLPIEVDYPEERIRYMLRDAEAGILVVDQDSVSPVSQLEGILYLEPAGPQLDRYPRENLTGSGKPDHYAYMIYTSGTTGKPKGVLVHQLGMINHLYAKINDLAITENDRLAHTASPCFDISVWQFLAALLEGGTTVIFDYETVLNPEALLRGLQEEQITIFESVPSLMSVFLEMLENKKNNELKELRWMIPTGEALKPSLVQQWFKYYPNIKLVNAYGPTEASDDITHYLINNGSDVKELSVPIGKPVQNMKIYILDKDLSLCPIGVRGEICTAGLGVGKGYWKNPEKNREVFIKNPYAIDDAKQDYAVLFKTGDIGYFREDGNIECLGRIDNQVKIRGFRIELEEIEAVMSQHPSLNECAVVIKKKQDGTDSIVGFLVEQESVDLEELKRFLLGYLPNYMVPSAFVKLDKFPLTVSGKTDRQALAVMDIDVLSSTPDAALEFVAPRSHLEKVIADIWADVLEKDAISVNDNFFDIGGHSLLVPRIHRKLEKQFPGKCKIADLFEHMTISRLSRHIHGTIETGEEEEIIELSID